MLFYGRKFGMSKQEILITTIGEMRDMISCNAIYSGFVRPAKKKLKFDEILQLR